MMISYLLINLNQQQNVAVKMDLCGYKNVNNFPNARSHPTNENVNRCE